MLARDQRYAACVARGVALDFELGNDAAEVDPHDWMLDQGANASAEPACRAQEFIRRPGTPSSTRERSRRDRMTASSARSANPGPSARRGRAWPRWSASRNLGELFAARDLSNRPHRN